MAGKSNAYRAKTARTRRLEVRLSEEELRRLDRNAEAASLDRSAYVRAQILREPGDAGKVLGKRDWEQIKELYAVFGGLNDLRAELVHDRYECSKLGVNLNQIARGINTALANGGPEKARLFEILLDENRAIKDMQRDVHETLVAFDEAIECVDETLAMAGEL